MPSNPGTMSGVNATDGGTIPDQPKASANVSNTLTFTFTNDASGKIVTQVELVIPAGWTAPQNTTPGDPGFVSISIGSCSTFPASFTVSGSTITIGSGLTSSLSCGFGESFTITYTGIAPNSTGYLNFVTSSLTSDVGSTLTQILLSPQIQTVWTPVSVTVDPSSVNETPTESMHYTFRRFCAVATSLTVTFDVSFSSATYTTDYTVSGAASFSGSTGTITIAADAATAVLTVTPVTDASADTPETVVLFVTPNSTAPSTADRYGYGEFAAATGTIGPETGAPDDPAVAVDYLLVAGGGCGGGLRGGGGGGGGVLSGTVSLTVGEYEVTIGGGGYYGDPGSDTEWNGLIAVGGGAGGSGAQGQVGGSGGGGGGNYAGGAPTSGQGYAGGRGAGTGTDAAGGGGGGGQGIGGNASALNGGTGGHPFPSSIGGTLTYYAGGGGGNGDTRSGTASGGGGKGGAGGNPGAAGVDGTGGGGGAGTASSSYGYAGGSGIAIFSYITGSMTATGGTITYAGGRTIHTFVDDDTFAVGSTTPTITYTPVTDLPVENRARLDAAGGTVRIGSKLTAYESTVGPAVEEGENAPGSTLAADVAVGATSLTVVDGTPFSTSYGWAKVGDQVIRYGSRSSTTLSGIPATGFGAFTAALKADTTITPLGAIRFSDTGIVFNPPMKSGEMVVQRVTVNDAASQATIAALTGGDGIVEHVISDDTLTVDGARTRATQELAAFSSAVQSITWQTRDVNASVGKRQTVTFDSLSTSLVITRVSITFPSQNSLPLRQCEATTVRTAGVFDAIVTST